MGRIHVYVSAVLLLCCLLHPVYSDVVSSIESSSLVNDVLSSLPSTSQLLSEHQDHVDHPVQSILSTVTELLESSSGQQLDSLSSSLLSQAPPPPQSSTTASKTVKIPVMSGNLRYNFESVQLANGAKLVAAQWIEGRHPHAGVISMNGDNQYVNLGSMHFGDSGWSMHMWVRVTTNDNQKWARFFDCGSGAGQDNIIFTRNGDRNDLSFIVYRNGIKQELVAFDQMEVDTWMSITIVQYAFDNTTIIYRDGAELTRGKVHLPTQTIRDKCYLGKSNWQGDAFLNGEFDKFTLKLGIEAKPEDILKRYQFDIAKPCEKNNGGCDPLTQCVENNGDPYGPPTCSKCPSGYMDYGLDGKSKCEDIDECASSNGGCDVRTRCTNTPGSRKCSNCPTGWFGKGDETCQDVDECMMNNGGCDFKTTCTNTVGSRKCSRCPDGYTGSGATGCMDVNECMANNGGCDTLTTCQNTPGSRTCGECPEGYNGKGDEVCTDIDECAVDNGGCDPLTRCLNRPGTFECGSCPTGYIGNGKTGCKDINECMTKNGGCDPLTQCFNTIGSRTCGECPQGYEGNGGTGCRDLNECALMNGGCHPLSRCINTPGSRDCGECPEGFSGDGTNGCQDIDECSLNNGGCDPLTSCFNLRGGFSCGPCPRGYRGTGDNGCLLLDVCKIVPNGGCDPLTKCTSNPRLRKGRKCGPCPKGMLGEGDSTCKPDKRFLKEMRMQKEMDLIIKGGNPYGTSYDADYMRDKLSRRVMRVMGQRAKDVAQYIPGYKERLEAEAKAAADKAQAEKDAAIAAENARLAALKNQQTTQLTQQVQAAAVVPAAAPANNDAINALNAKVDALTKTINDQKDAQDTASRIRAEADAQSKQILDKARATVRDMYSSAGQASPAAASTSSSTSFSSSVQTLQTESRSSQMSQGLGFSFLDAASQTEATSQQLAKLEALEKQELQMEQETAQLLKIKTIQGVDGAVNMLVRSTQALASEIAAQEEINLDLPAPPATFL